MNDAIEIPSGQKWLANTGLNIITSLNGRGKTSLLTAIHKNISNYKLVRFIDVDYKPPILASYTDYKLPMMTTLTLNNHYFSGDIDADIIKNIMDTRANFNRHRGNTSYNEALKHGKD